MCNCNELPACVADIELWLNRFSFQGALIHHRHFETPDREYLEPSVECQASMYRCMQCGQHWYIEGTPDENSTPEFALKAAKEYLCILAHGGFDSEKCRIVGCPNHKLVGRELCHLHIPFPS